jgi:MFS family permease
MLYGSLPSHVRGNLLKLNVIKFSKWFSVVMPIIVPFYQDNDLSITSIMTLKSVYAITIIVLELPSGYFSDLLGRKKMLVTGSILGAAGYFVYSLTDSYAGFLIAEIALGAGQSFISGTDSAMLFDTLASAQKQKQYTRYEGINTSVGNFSEAFAGIAGGGLALISLRLPFCVQAIIATSAIPAALTLVEPHIPRPERTHDRMKKITGVLAKIMRHEKDLRFNLLFSSIIGAATLLMAWFAQPLFEKMLLPLALFGVVWTGLNLVTGGSSVLAHRLEARLGELRTLKLIAVCIPILMILSGIVPAFAIIPVLVVFYFLRGIATPVLKDYINQRTGTEVRATVMSLRDLTIRVFFALFAPMAGWLTDHYSLGTGLAAMGGFLMIFSLLTLVLFMKYRLKNQNMRTENFKSSQNEN